VQVIDVAAEAGPINHNFDEANAGEDLTFDAFISDSWEGLVWYNSNCKLHGLNK
jgi:hypothetical protein